MARSPRQVENKCIIAYKRSNIVVVIVNFAVNTRQVKNKGGPSSDWDSGFRQITHHFQRYD